jgi:hypothetical protein
VGLQRIKLGGSDRLKGSAVEDTWTSRDLPVLEAVVRLLDEGARHVWVRDIAGATGLEPVDVGRAFRALEGPFIDDVVPMPGLVSPNDWAVSSVTAEARYAVGQWPTPESLVERLADAFNEAADRESDEKRRGRIREIAGMLTGSLREFAVGVAAEVVARKIP